MKWIPVSETLPQPGQIVLLWHKSQITYALGIYCGRFYFSHIYLYADAGLDKRGIPNEAYIKDVNAQDITHWMPLPESPDRQATKDK